jgi:hypothetical protein
VIELRKSTAVILLVLHTGVFAQAPDHERPKCADQQLLDMILESSSIPANHITETLVGKKMDSNFFGVWCFEAAIKETVPVVISHFSDGTYAAVAAMDEVLVEIGEWSVVDGYYIQKRRGHISEGKFVPDEKRQLPYYEPFRIVSVDKRTLELESLAPKSIVQLRKVE